MAEMQDVEEETWYDPDYESDEDVGLHQVISSTEYRDYEYFKECIDSAKKIGSNTLDLSIRAESREIFYKDYIYLTNQLKDSDIENINFQSFYIDDDKLTIISDVFKHNKIKDLNLKSKHFGEKGLLALTSALKESKIEVLNLSHNRSMANRIHILTDSLPFTKVTSLNLGYSDLNADCFIKLSDALASTKITVLSLNNCRLNPMCIQYLSTKLSNSKIQSLNLAKNTMFLDSLKSLADVLENTAITELNIAGNEFGPSGAVYLAGKLSKSVVQDLDIGDNMIESEGCSAIGDVIHLTLISKLNLEQNIIDSNGITSLAKNLKKSNVKHLNLNENYLDVNGAQALANGMKDSKLEYLNVDYNDLRNAGMGMILDALQFTKVTDFNLNCVNNRMNAENMQMVTNTFKFFKLKQLKLSLPKNENTVRLFFNELKTLIESDQPDEILSIKNKMNFLIEFNYRSSPMISMPNLLGAIKHFHMKKLILNNLYLDLESSILSMVNVLIDTRNPISNITTLNLNGNRFEDEGAIVLARNFKYLKITRLELNKCEIKNDGVIAIADELKNSQIRYLNLGNNSFGSAAASYIVNVVKNYPVKIYLANWYSGYKGFSAESKVVMKNIDYMFLKAQLLVRAVSDNSPVKYDKDTLQHLKAYEIFKNVDLLWESKCGKPKYDYHRIDSEIRTKVTRNFLKIIGIVNSDIIDSSLLPTEIIIMICSYLKINDIKFD